MSVSSYQLEGAQHVEHAGSLEVPFPAQVGRALAEDLLHADRVSDELLGTRQHQGRGTADVRRRHARAVEALGAAAGDQRGDLLRRRDEVGLVAAVAGRATAGEVGDAVAERTRAMRSTERDKGLGVPGIGDADAAEAE